MRRLTPDQILAKFEAKFEAGKILLLFFPLVTNHFSR